MEQTPARDKDPIKGGKSTAKQIFLSRKEPKVLLRE
jgi:hypothetical protein